MGGRGGIKGLDYELVSQAIETVLSSLDVEKEHKKTDIYLLLRNEFMRLIKLKTGKLTNQLNNKRSNNYAMRLAHFLQETKLNRYGWKTIKRNEYEFHNGKKHLREIRKIKRIKNE